MEADEGGWRAPASGVCSWGGLEKAVSLPLKGFLKRAFYGSIASRTTRQLLSRVVLRTRFASRELPVKERTMPESKSHKDAKSRAAGPSGRTEVPLSGNRRLDARTPVKATEIERSGNADALSRAAGRLKSSHAPQKVLQVPQKDVSKAVEAVRKVGISATVKNMGGTKSRGVSRRGR